MAKENIRPRQSVDRAGDADGVYEFRRLSALDALAIMDTSPEERFDRLARLAKNQFKASVVLITFIGKERQWFKSHLGTDQTEGSRAVAFCNQTIKEDRILYVPDATQDEDFRNNPQVIGPPHIRFYAGAPIRTPDGFRIGSLCLVDTEPKTLTPDDLKCLRDIADCVEDELAKSDRGAVYAAHQASRLSAVLDTVSDAILTLDENGVIRTVNAAAEALFKYTAEELIGRNLDTLLSVTFRLRLDPRAEAADHIWVDMDDSDQYVQAQRKDGSTFHMLLTVAEMAHFNQRQFVAIGRDITEQKTQEWYLDAIIENIPNMVFVKDADDLRFTLFNKAGEELIGTPREELVGKSDFDFLPTDQAEFFQSIDREVLKQDTPMDIWEEPFTSKTKGDRILHTRKVAIRDEAGTAKYLLGISQDITERKQIELDLATSLEETERASRGKSEFLAHMSHELRSPLNSIIGFSQIMRDQQFGELNARYVEYSSDIFNSANHLLELINEILDISRIEAGELGLDETEFDISVPIEEAVRQMDVHVNGKGQTLANSVPANSFSLRADSRQIRQIMINLLSNAVRFTPEQGTISVQANRDVGGDLILEVSDTGIGIAAEDIPKVLEPFGQVRQASLLSHEGTGLGLTLSKQLAELHGGTLSISSVPSEGTTVRVTIPAARLL